jgi:hypothetical protein
MNQLEVAVRHRGTATRAWQERVARLLTEVFAPVVLIFALLIIVSIHATGSFANGVGLGLLAALFAGGLPYAILMLGVRRGRLGDRHLSRREERPLMMVLGLISVSCGLLVMHWLDAPREIYALVVAMVAGVAVALAISLFWKISIHTACVAGSVAVLTIVLGGAYAALGAVVLAVGWARVTLRDHTASQVAAGALVGAAVGASVMATLA